jgi:hypothetical protein
MSSSELSAARSIRLDMKEFIASMVDDERGGVVVVLLGWLGPMNVKKKEKAKDLTG